MADDLDRETVMLLSGVRNWGISAPSMAPHVRVQQVDKASIIGQLFLEGHVALPFGRVEGPRQMSRGLRHATPLVFVLGGGAAFGG